MLLAFSLHISHTTCQVVGNIQKAPCSRANGGAQLRCLQRLDNPEWGPEAEWIGQRSWRAIHQCLNALEVQRIHISCIHKIERERKVIFVLISTWPGPSRINVLDFGTGILQNLRGPPVALADSALPIGSPPLWGCPDFNDSFVKHLKFWCLRCVCFSWFFSCFF